VIQICSGPSLLASTQQEIESVRFLITNIAREHYTPIVTAKSRSLFGLRNGRCKLRGVVLQVMRWGARSKAVPRRLKPSSMWETSGTSKLMPSQHILGRRLLLRQIRSTDFF
jgi:hypothetical protein